jgi:hypothetical protein
MLLAVIAGVKPAAGNARFSEEKYLIEMEE